jgi:hypothetical protein
MPSRERVEAFVAMVVADEHVQAIEDFYWPEASMQENGQPPREGRDGLVAREADFLLRVKVHTHPPRAVLVDGDQVAIFWVCVRHHNARWRHAPTRGDGSANLARRSHRDRTVLL